MRPSYSIICSVYNEEAYLPDLLAFLTQYTPTPSQIVLKDGGSTDRSNEIINEWQKKLPQLLKIDNPERTVPYALNRAIP